MVGLLAHVEGPLGAALGHAHRVSLRRHLSDEHVHRTVLRRQTGDEIPGEDDQVVVVVVAVEIAGLAGLELQVPDADPVVLEEDPVADVSEGVALVLELAQRCDVVVENFRPGVAARLGVGYEEIGAVRPDVIYASISGYGQTGRDAQRRAYAPVVHAEVGLLAFKARECEIDPVPEPVSHADIAVGMAAAQGVLAALFKRLSKTSPRTPWPR